MIKPLSGSGMEGLVYEDTPRYDFWLKFLLAAILALTFIPGVIFLFTETTVAWVMFGATLLDALLLGAILPRRYQIYRDRVKIVLGGPFALNIPLSDIKEARSASGSQSYIYWGIRLATSSNGVIEIVRKKGLSLVISPANADRFLEQLDQVLGTVPDSG
jgi:hypothetical protein